MAIKGIKGDVMNGFKLVRFEYGVLVSAFSRQRYFLCRNGSLVCRQ